MRNWRHYGTRGAGDNYHPLPCTLRTSWLCSRTCRVRGVVGPHSELESRYRGNPRQRHVRVPARIPTAVFDENAEDFLAFEGRLFDLSVFPQTVIWGPYVYLSRRHKTTGSALWQVEPKRPGHVCKCSCRNFIDRDTPAPVREFLRHKLSAQQAFCGRRLRGKPVLQRSAVERSADSSRCAISPRERQRSRKVGRGRHHLLAPQKDDGQWLSASLVSR